MTIKPQLERLFKDKKLSTEDFYTIIIEYVDKELGREPTSEELEIIHKLFKSGAFSFEYVIDRIGSQPGKYGIQIENLYLKSGELIKRYVYNL